ncbi:MAG: NADPH-dependent FMN reductase [Acidimicrobiales bacterium]
MPTLQILVASTRPGRIGLPIAEWVRAHAVEHGGFDVELVDLADIDLPLFDEPTHPMLGQYTHDHTKRWAETVARADAFVFVMPEYNHGFNAALKNALDFLYNEWSHKPVGFVSYGGVAAGTRAVGLLKPVLAALQMVPVIQAVPIPFAAGMVDDGVFAGSEQLDTAVTNMLGGIERMIPVVAPLRTRHP